MFRKGIVTVILSTATWLLIVGCGRVLKPQESCNFVMNESIQRVSWKQLPVKVFVHESVPNGFIQDIRDSAAFWNKNYGRDLLRIEAEGVTGHPDAIRDGYSMVYMKSKGQWPPDRSQEHASTTVYWVGKDLIEADVQVNNDTYSYFLDENPDPARVHFKSVMIHEFGHILGLAHAGKTHQEEPTSVMNVDLGLGYLRDKPTDATKDLTSLKCEY